MSTPINDGGPAFPTEQGHIPDGTWNQTYEPGMCLRDFFAAKAMQGLLGHYGCDHPYPIKSDPSPWAAHAQWAYDMADAMLKAGEATS